MIPVMIWGYAINGKSYKLQDYAIAVGVMHGSADFATYGTTTSKKHGKTAAETGAYGVALMLGYLGFDGVRVLFS